MDDFKPQRDVKKTPEGNAKKDTVIFGLNLNEGDIYFKFIKRLLVIFILALALAGGIIGTILIVSSLGEPLAKVPSVRGKDVLEATMDIAINDLTVNIDTKYDPNAPRFLVIDQFPKPGVMVRKGRAITLIVSMGRDIYKVPDLVGLRKSEAEALLNKNSIPYQVDVIQTDKYPLDTVTAQDLRAGSEVDRMTKIRILVNSDVRRNEFKVGSYINQPIDKVAADMLDASVFPIIEKTVVNDKNQDGLVLAQNISSGTVIPRNSDIRLQVGVYGDDDLSRRSLNYHMFVYNVEKIEMEAEIEEVYIDLFEKEVREKEKARKAKMTESYVNVRMIVKDEMNTSGYEIYNKQAKYGDRLMVVFKSYGKSELNVLLDNNFAKARVFDGK